MACYKILTTDDIIDKHSPFPVQIDTEENKKQTDDSKGQRHRYDDGVPFG